ncbi:MAG: hypothetical protein LBD07_01925 [Spirochaetaceae bacterium]|nr:hypothetical protein [Spirochaetaceae bacterium]
MKKKLLSLLAAFVVLSSSVSALEIPVIAGIGTFVDYNITTYGAKSVSQEDFHGETNYSIFSFGWFTFFDIRYVDFSFGFAGLFNKIKSNLTLSGTTGADWANLSCSGATLHFSLSGKYPFDLGFFDIYPLLGIEYRRCISMRLTEDTEFDHQKRGDSLMGNASDWSAFWFRIGAGMDLHMGEAWFIRSELTFGIKLNTAREAELIRRLQANNYDFKDASGFGGGGKLVIAIGYHFTDYSLPSSSFNLSNIWGRGNKQKGGGGGGSGDIYRPTH